MLHAYANDKARLLELLRNKSFAQKKVTLASGRVSDWYIDVRQTSFDGEGAMLLGRLLLREVQALEIHHDTQYAIGGLELGAVPIATAVSMTAALAGHELTAFTVRKEPKTHGAKLPIEGLGAIKPPRSVVVVEDVITTGASALKAVTTLRDAGYSVSAVLAVVDRGEDGGRGRLELEGLEVRALFGRDDFMPNVL